MYHVLDRSVVVELDAILIQGQNQKSAFPDGGTATWKREKMWHLHSKTSQTESDIVRNNSWSPHVPVFGPLLNSRRIARVAQTSAAKPAVNLG